MRPVATFLVVALGGAVLDLASKHAAFDQIGPGASWEVWPGWFHLTCVTNPGVVWGLFPGLGDIFLVLSSLAVPILIALFVRLQRDRTDWLLTLGLATILAGTLGNFYDRARFGEVRDFLYAACIDWPVFNLADVWICVGASMFALHVLRTPETALSGPHSGTDSPGSEGAGSPNNRIAPSGRFP